MNCEWLNGFFDSDECAVCRRVSAWCPRLRGCCSCATSAGTDGDAGGVEVAAEGFRMYADVTRGACTAFSYDALWPRASATAFCSLSTATIASEDPGDGKGRLRDRRVRYRGGTGAAAGAVAAGGVASAIAEAPLPSHGRPH